MVDATVGVRIRSEGASELKARMMELRTEFERGEISVAEYSKGLRGVNRDAGALTRQSQIANRVFMASHPTINALSRTMSTFGHVTRTAFAATTAISTAFSAFGNRKSNLMELQSELAEAERNFIRLKEAGDEIGASEWQEKMDIVKEKIKEVNDSSSQEKLANVFNFLGTAGILATGVGQMSKVVDKIPYVNKAFGGMVTAIGGKADITKPMGALSSFNSGLRTSNSRLGSLKGALNITAAAGLFGVGIAGATGHLDDFYESLTGQKLSKGQASLMNDLGTLGGFAAGGAVAGNMIVPGVGAVAGGAIGALAGLVKLLGEMTTLTPAGGAFIQTPSDKLKVSDTISAMVTPGAGGSPASSASTFKYKGLTGQAAINAKAAGFADGGIIKEPAVMFGLRSGGMGIMAEKGPEAIMPLKSSGGSKGGDIHIHLHGGSILAESQVWGIVNKYGLRDLKRSGF